MTEPEEFKNGWQAWDATAASQRPNPYALPDDLNPDDRVQLRFSDGSKRLFSIRARRARWASFSPRPSITAYRRCLDFTLEGTEE